MNPRPSNLALARYRFCLLARLAWLGLRLLVRPH